jgi:hypothetical protein
MKARWTLTYGDATKTLAQWGVKRVVRTCVSSGVDTVTFSAAHGDVNQEPFVYGETIKIQRDGVQWFVGRVFASDFNVSGRQESINYTLAGPWWWLENLIFLQPWQTYYNQSGAKQTILTSHVFLHIDSTGLTPINTAFRTVIEYARTKGAPIQVGELDLPITPPIEEVRDMTCAECLVRMLRWQPDAVTWIDYKTNPPTLHAKRKQNLAKAPALRFGEAQGLQFIPRRDLQRPSVAIRYEMVKTVDGQSQLLVVDDIAPAGAPGDALGGLIFTVNLQGPTITTLSGRIETAPIDYQNASWWKDKFPTELRGKGIQRAVFSSAQGYTPKRSNPNGLPRYFVGGSGGIADWMNVTAVEETFEAWFEVESRQDDWPAETPNNRERVYKTITLLTTDAQSGEVTGDPSITPGEPVPQGIAAQLYETLKKLEYQGSFTLVDQASSGKVGLGMVATIQRDDVGAVDVTVQETVEQVDTGHTLVRFAPSAKHSVNDLIELLR